MYAGEFDPGGGNSATHLASTAFSGSPSGLNSWFRRAAANPMPGTNAAYPSDIAVDPQGTVYALSYLPESPGQCTELLRFDNGVGAPPTNLRVGCVGNYSKLQFSSAGTLYLLASTSGLQLRVGVSADRGQTWMWNDVPVVGLPSGDVSVFAPTPIKPYTSPNVFDPNIVRVYPTRKDRETKGCALNGDCANVCACPFFKASPIRSATHRSSIYRG